jgi:hypothetical protein
VLVTSAKSVWVTGVVAVPTVNPAVCLVGGYWDEDVYVDRKGYGSCQEGCSLT